jgi:hypothetical protein
MLPKNLPTVLLPPEVPPSYAHFHQLKSLAGTQKTWLSTGILVVHPARPAQQTTLLPEDSMAQCAELLTALTTS